MSAANDILFGLERNLDKCPPGSPAWATERRLLLRAALEKAEDDGRRQGYANGMRDAADADLAEKEWNRQHPEEAPEGSR